MKIRPVKPFFHEEDINFILEESRKILSGGGKLTQGKFCKKFEEEYASYVGSKFAIATNSCTSGLDAIFRSIGVEDREIIIPANTFAATAYGVIHAGGIPVFADIDNTMNLDPESVKENINDNTAGICIVHMGGYITPKIDEILDICDSRNIFLIEDAAHGHGCSIDEMNAGNIGLAASFSFFSTKVITTGEGGMITTNDAELHDKASIIVNQGKIPKDRIPVGNGVYQNWQEYLGHNFRMTEFAAIMGLTQLRRLDDFVKDRSKTAKLYYEKLANVQGMELLPISDRVIHNYYKIYAFIDENIDRIKMYKDLKIEGVSLSGMTYEIPLHKIPAFKKYYKRSLSQSEKLCESHICLPIYYDMKLDEVDKVCDTIKEWLINNN